MTMADSPVLKRIKTTDSEDSSTCITHCLPIDVLVEIAAKVASQSLEDLYHLKMTSKDIMNITDDEYVYKHASLDKVPFFTNPENPQQASFLNRCRSSGNLESLYREGMETYFWNSKLYDKGLDIIRMAAQKGHKRSMYAFAMIVLMRHTVIDFSEAGDSEEALGYLRFLRNQKCVLKCRNDVGRFVSKLRWNSRSNVVQVPIKRLCDNVPCKNTWRLKTGSWWFMTEDDDENDPKMCENCRWEDELVDFCAKILNLFPLCLRQHLT